MAKIDFSDTKLRSLSPPEKGQRSYWDTKLPSFGVRVSQGGTKTFILKRQNEFITIGRYGVLTLAEARTEARKLLAEFTLGKTRPQSISFEKAKELFLNEKRKSRRANTVANHEDRLTRHFTFTGQLADVTHQDVARRLGRIATNAEHDHALSVAKTFFTWAQNRRYITDNPCRGLFPRGHTSRSRVLTDDELKAVWMAADHVGGHFGTIVKLLILTGQRRGEIAALQADFITGDTCTLPATLTKNGRSHTFPLGTLAAELLPTSPATSNKLLFPARGRDDRPTNGWSKSKRTLDATSGVHDWTLHDLRRTFATRLAELGVAPHVVERLLNHVSGTISGVAVYNRAKYLEEMAAAVKLWEEYLTKLLAVADKKRAAA